jgi:hypothetical protein
MGIVERLTEISVFYHKEAHKCSRARAYFSACVMQVASFEAALQAMCSLYRRDVRKTTVYQRKRFRTTRNRALEFSLYELINIADELAWFPATRFTWAGKRATIGEFSHEIREVRNYVHPGKWVREHPTTTKPSKGWDAVICEVCDVAFFWLSRRLGF